jgi:glycosyltransferase involved in cell wall biosynthesis
MPELVARFRKIYKNGLFELILVDNGSSDDSWQVLERVAREYNFIKPIKINKNIGYGHGIITGLSHATGDVLAWTHADLQTDPEDVIRAYNLYLNGAGGGGKRIVRGRRVNRRLSDYIFTFGMSLIASIVLGKNLLNIKAQPKLFDREFYALMKNPPQDFSLDLYWLYLVKRYGYRDLEVPVIFRGRQHGISKSSPSFKARIKTSMRTILYIFRLKKFLF